MATKKTLQDRIRIRRTELNLKQTEAAEKAGFHQSLWAKIETGVRTPDLATIIKIAAVLEISVDDLLDIKPLPDSIRAEDTIERHLLLDFRKRQEELRVTILHEEIAKLAQPIRKQIQRLIGLLKPNGESDSDLNES